MPELYGKLKKEMADYFASIDLVYLGAGTSAQAPGEGKKPLTKAERAAWQKAREERLKKKAEKQK